MEKVDRVGVYYAVITMSYILLSGSLAVIVYQMVKISQLKKKRNNKDISIAESKPKLKRHYALLGFGLVSLAFVGVLLYGVHKYVAGFLMCYIIWGCVQVGCMILYVLYSAIAGFLTCKKYILYWTVCCIIISFLVCIATVYKDLLK